MKNFKLLLAGAMMIAVGSSFAASGNNAVAGEYVLINGTYHLKSERPEGSDCVQSNEICDYTKINPAGNNTDPANFQAHRAGTWTEE